MPAYCYHISKKSITKGFQTQIHEKETFWALFIMRCPSEYGSTYTANY